MSTWTPIPSPTIAAEVSEDPDNDRRSAEEVLLTSIDALADDRLTHFTVHLALTGHRGIAHEHELDILAEAEAVFLAKEPEKAGKGRNVHSLVEATPNTVEKDAAKEDERENHVNQAKLKKNTAKA